MVASMFLGSTDNLWRCSVFLEMVREIFERNLKCRLAEDLREKDKNYP